MLQDTYALVLELWKDSLESGLIQNITHRVTSHWRELTQPEMRQLTQQLLSEETTGKAINQMGRAIGIFMKARPERQEFL